MTAQLFSTPSLRADGYTYYDVRRLLRDGMLTSVRRGTYVVGELPDDAAARHRVAVLAAVGELGAGAVVSHVSAAVLHRLPIWSIPLNRVHITRSRANGARRSRYVQMHGATLNPGEIVTVDGVLVTSPARTVVDLARTVPFEQAVVVADAALAVGLVDTEGLGEVLERLVRRRGIPLARRAAAFADARTESVGESRSRVAIARAGLPPPELQWVVRDEAGQLVGRTDFAWPDHGVIGEFDGQIKYGRLLRPGQSPGDVIFAEKIREDQLRDERWEVVRWTWPDLAAFEAVVSRWLRAKQRSRRNW